MHIKDLLRNQTGQGRTSSVLYIASATPLPLKLYTSSAVGAPPSCGVYTSWSLPGPGATKSVARYWSPNAWRPITIGLIHPGTGRGMRSRTIGSRKTVPPRILRICARAREREERGREPRQRKVLWRRRRGRGCRKKSGSAGTDGRTAAVRNSSLPTIGCKYVRCHWENATSASD